MRLISTWLVTGVVFKRALLTLLTCFLSMPFRGGQCLSLVRLSIKSTPNRSNSNWLWAGRQRGRCSSPGRVKNFLISMSSRPAMGSTQPPIQWVPGALSRGVKRPGREADHSPPASAEVKKTWIYTSTPPYAFMA
jgi:hypothetical protein